jgi:glycosyltransferase involved in cell wall biosynthesis
MGGAANDAGNVSRSSIPPDPPYPFVWSIPVIVSFVFPSSRQRTGGVTMLYEYANALARRGHEIHFVHGPKGEHRVDRVEQIPFAFEASVRHHIVDSPDDPSLPVGDVQFGWKGSRLGHPAVFVQGFRLLGPRADAPAFRSPTPKVCTAGWLVDVGRAYGVPEHQLVHVPYGMDHETFAVRNSSARSIDVAMLYHPLREKGWDVGRQVLERLARQRPGFRAVVFTLADPPPEPLPDGVEVMVGLDHRRLADEVYNNTRVFTQASYHEGFGLTAIESMACGAALVTTDCGGSRDYAIPGETALVVAAGDASSLGDRVESLLDDDEQRGALAAAGERYVRKFDWEHSGLLLETFLDRYLADPEHYQQSPGEDHSSDYAL